MIEKIRNVQDVYKKQCIHTRKLLPLKLRYFKSAKTKEITLPYTGTILDRRSKTFSVGANGKERKSNLVTNLRSV
jgi:hypothetical protein